MSTHRIRVAWHQLYLTPFDTSPQFIGAGAGTLVAVAEVPGHLIVRTGCATGPVRATLTVHSASPEVTLDSGPGGTGPWEAVEEVSMPVTEPLFWFSPEPGPDLPTEAAFAPATPGPHRFRISARGRNLAYDLAILEPVEDYLIQVWPEPDLRAPSVILSDR